MDVAEVASSKAHLRRLPGALVMRYINLEVLSIGVFSLKDVCNSFRDHRIGNKAIMTYAIV